MRLPEEQLRRLEQGGLVLRPSAPADAEAGGWRGRLTIGATTQRVDDIEVLPGPILWLYWEDGCWWTQSSSNDVADPDFHRRHASAEEAVASVLRCFNRS